MFTIDEGTTYVLATYPHGDNVVFKVKQTTKENTFIPEDLVINRDKCYDTKVAKNMVYFLSGDWVGFRRGGYVLLIFFYLVKDTRFKCIHYS